MKVKILPRVVLTRSTSLNWETDKTQSFGQQYFLKQKRKRNFTKYICILCYYAYLNIFYIAKRKILWNITVVWTIYIHTIYHRVFYGMVGFINIYDVSTKRNETNRGFNII